MLTISSICISAMSAMDTFWSTPPIQDTIASYLAEVDFVQCIQVSQALHSAFIPLLWKNITLSQEQPFKHFITSPAQKSHHHHVKALHIMLPHSQELDLFLETHKCFPHLTTLTWNCQPPEKFAGCDFLHFAAAHPTLGRLHIQRQEFSTEFLNLFLDTMSNNRLPALQDLWLRFEDSVSIRDLAGMMKTCVHLEKLVLDCDMNFSAPMFQLQELEFETAMIKHLEFLPRGVGMTGLVTRFLEFCPQLEKLQLDTMLDEQGDPERLALVLNSCCYRLKELRLLSQFTSSSGLDTVLRGCPMLSHLVLCLPDDDIESIVQTICMRHGGSLEVLEMDDGEPLSLEDFFLVAQSCPRLKKAFFAIHWNLYWSEELLGTMCSEKSLAFNQLEELDIYFAGVSYTTSTVSAAVLDSFFMQVGSLTRLRHLALLAGPGCPAFTEAFVRGMDHFFKLKEMRVFLFSDCNASALTTEQLESLVRHWPRIESIGALCGERRGVPGKTVVANLKAGMSEREKGIAL